MITRTALFIFLLLTSATAQAHLLPKQNATMKIVDDTANFVVSVPASALVGIDDNGDGELSTQEIQTHEELIKQQFTSRFTVTNNGTPGTGFMLMVMSPQTDGDHHHSDYVVILHRVKFDETPRNPVVKTDLFGTRDGEGRMALRATMDDAQEVAVLTPKNSEHRFFKPAKASSKEPVDEEKKQTSGGHDQWLFLLALIPASGAILYLRRAKRV
ncbi:hypothetical protein [Parasphingorhabdus sp.]|uniref:hypothetical protein n=1 Tax=Parasphingorhabdus sp. TaxID=2709688 RepID=UPI003C70C97A